MTAEIITRVTTFADDQSAQAKAQEMGWVTSDLEYNYLDWNAEEQRLVPRQEETLTQDQILTDARRLKTLLKEQELIRTRAEVRGTTVYASDTLPLGDIEGISTSPTSEMSARKHCRCFR